MVLLLLIISLKMQRSTFQSELQGRESFAETFGRGCLIKHKEPSYSQRNNFELAKMNVDRNVRLGLQTHRQWLASEPQMVYRKQQAPQPVLRKQYPAESSQYPSRCEDFERIEQINNKICGLIKSISTSCHKKPPIEFKHQRDSLKKATNVTHISKEKNQDYAKTQHKKRAQIDHEPMRPKLLDFGQDKRQEKYTSYLKREMSFGNSEGTADINDRIKKINDKISIYQNKIRGDIKQPSINSHELSRNRPLKQYTNFNNLPQTPNKVDKKQPAQKFTQNRMRYIQNSDSKAKENYNKVERNAELYRKTGVFNERHPQITVKNIKNQESPSFEITSKESIVDRTGKEQPRKYVLFQRVAINTINNQLLSYKTQFLKEIVRQIALDQDFRHAKHMFGGIQGLFELTDGSIKWNNLQRQLKQEGFNLPLSDVKEIFMPRDDQIDPFMSVSHSHEELIHGLIQSYRSCERHWNENIYHSWTLWELKESRFTGECLDKAKKGFITLEDLTFYLNTELDGNYRNRDLLLIFNRFKTRPKGKPLSDRPQQLGVRFKDIMDKLLSV